MHLETNAPSRRAEPRPTPPPASRATLPWRSLVDVFEYVVERFEPLGDTVLVFAKERCRVKSTGKFFENEHVGIATIRDGHMVRYLEYSDTAALQAAFAE